MIPQDYPRTLIIPGTQAAKSNTNWSSETLSNAYYMGGRLTSTGAQFAKRAFEVALAAGTYTLDLWFDSGTNRGIVNVYIDDVLAGTIDEYAGSAVAMVHSTITGIVLATSGLHRVELRMDTKNGSSSSYVASIHALGFTRTA